MPELKIGVVAVSRDCFPESLSVSRREALMKAYKEKYGEEHIYECPICIVESEIHMVQALEDIKKAGCNALVVYLGNFGPEISETLLAKHFDGPKMFVAAAEESGNNLIQGRGDAYCGMLNACISQDAVTLLDINNSVPADLYEEDIKGKFDYTLKDTFMGFHCGNTASSKLSFCEMKYQMIMARSLPIEVTQGTLEGDIKPGDITFFRLQSTSDNVLRAYIAHGEVLPVATRSFGAIGIFAIPEMGRFYRHVLIEKNFPHHGAVAFGHYGKALYEVFKYIGVPVDEIGYNQPKGVRYPTENPWG